MYIDCTSTRMTGDGVRKGGNAERDYMIWYRNTYGESDSDDSYDEYAGWEPKNALEWDDYFNTFEQREPWDDQMEMKYYEEKAREVQAANNYLDHITELTRAHIKREDKKKQAEINRCTALAVFKTMDTLEHDIDTLNTSTFNVPLQIKETIELSLAATANKSPRLESFPNFRKKMRIKEVQGQDPVIAA